MKYFNIASLVGGAVLTLNAYSASLTPQTNIDQIVQPDSERLHQVESTTPKNSEIPSYIGNLIKNPKKYIHVIKKIEAGNEHFDQAEELHTQSKNPASSLTKAAIEYRNALALIGMDACKVDESNDEKMMKAIIYNHLKVTSYLLSQATEEEKFLREAAKYLRLQLDCDPDAKRNKSQIDDLLEWFIGEEESKKVDI